MNSLIEKNIIDHYENNWNTADSYFVTLEQGPMKQKNEQFTIMVIPPNKDREMWTYATIGMSFANEPNPTEIHLFSPKEEDDLAEILTAVAYYKFLGNNLHEGDTVNFGRPWIDFSKCSYGLLSLPYMDGPKLENLLVNDTKISFYWLIPITKEERNYRWYHGLNKLENLFEEKNFNYLNPYRDSIV